MVLIFSVAVVTSFISRFHSDHRRKPLRERCYFFCESSFIAFGALLVIWSPLPDGENSVVFEPSSSTFGIDVDSVVFRSIQTMLCSGVS